MASGNGSQYPYLSEKDWNRFKTQPEKLESLNAFKKIELEEKFENFSLSQNKLKEKCPPQSDASDALRLVIIGKTGQGKSATANTILGKVRFEEDFTASSVTKDSRCVTEVVDGRKIRVMDTPGLQDTHQSNASILKELARMTTLFPDGVHAFIYVMNMADPRFTAEDKNVLDLIEKTFGGAFKRYCLLVFSHGDSELKDVDLDTYRIKQMEIGNATRGNRAQQYFRSFQRVQDQDQKSLANLLNELSWKMLAVDNKTSISFEKAHYRKQIVAMVDRMRSWNTPEIYTNDMFVEAQKEREAMKRKGLLKGWEPSVMSKVETILAANPEISREQLKEEVIRQLQNERDEQFQKEELERQELREKEEKEWKLVQERKEIERQKRFQREEKERQMRATKEQEKHLKRMMEQREEWEKRRKEEKEEYEKRQQHQEELWARQVREIEDEHRNLLEKAIGVIVSISKKVVGWIF